MLSKQKTMEAIEKMYQMFPEAHGELQPATKPPRNSFSTS